jgi:hypothetical protein
MSGLNTVSAKSEVFCFGNYVEQVQIYEKKITYKPGMLPLKYLRLSIYKS